MRNDIPLYFDNAATTALAPEVAVAMADFLLQPQAFGNPSSSHAYGVAAKKIVETAREQVAALINANANEIFFTSGATESNNLAITGVAQAYQHLGKHIITVSTEHKSVLEPIKKLQQQGFDVTFLQPEADGVIDIAKLQQAIRKDTILVSVMHVNNEIGVIQDVAKIASIVKGQDKIFHVDAVQSAGKIALDVQQIKADLISFSAHKVHGPKGVGALYRRHLPRTQLQPLIVGGSQEKGIRAGTLAPHQILAMGKAFTVAKSSLEQSFKHVSALKQRFLQGIATLPQVKVNGSAINGSPYIINASFVGINGEALVTALRQLAVSTGSACSSTNLEPSYVLRAIGISGAVADSAIRFSFSRYTTVAEVDNAIEVICHQVARLRQLLPVTVKKYYE